MTSTLSVTKTYAILIDGSPILELIQNQPLSPKYSQCSPVKAFQVITGNPQISVLPSLQILHTGRLLVILSNAY